MVTISYRRGTLSFTFFVFGQIVGFTLSNQDVSHADKHGKPNKMKQDQHTNQDYKYWLVHDVIYGRDIAICTDQPGFKQDRLVNDKGKDVQPGDQPYQHHGCEAGRGGGLPFQEICQLGEIDRNVRYIVYQENHTSYPCEAKKGGPNDQQIGDNVVDEHLSKIPPDRLGPLESDRKLPATVPTMDVLECNFKRKLQQAHHGFDVVGGLDQIIPNHARFDRLVRKVVKQRFSPECTGWSSHPGGPPRFVPKQGDSSHRNGRMEA
mmetsp:Transcript_21567/g.40271  ORF Transcript_21567/g.40271 Transcript_21567/m.40271 type:complete len:263 (-) Transcript_21567:154-942(-)